MPMRTMRIPVSLSALSALLVATAAHAQTTPPSGSDPSPVSPNAAPTTPPGHTAEPPAESAPPAPQLAEPPKPPPWFTRPMYEVSVGKDDAKWKAQIYGFAEFDAINDSTRSFNDSQGNGQIARDTAYAGQVGRTQFTARNSRFGVKVTAPKFEGIKTTGVVEVDFMANPGAFSTAGYPLAPSASGISEASNYNNGVFRTRHAYVKIEDDVVDILAGQTYYLFGNQYVFFPCTAEFLNLPGMAFGRTAQLRLSKTIDTDEKNKNSGVKVDIGIAAMRPPQRDSATPEGQAALRVGFKDWQGIHTPGSGGTTADPLMIGVSGTVRRFKVLGFQPNPMDSSSDTGWGVAVDALIPVIPVKDSNDRANALTLNGEFTTGSGYADQLGGLTGGASFPAYPMPAMGGTQAVANIDGGMVTYDPSGNGVLHTIDWQTYMMGIQYYLPPSGRLFTSANYTHAESKNLVDLMGGPTSARGRGVMKDTTYWNINLFFDVTPAVRTGLSFNYTTQHYGDGAEVRNMRWFGSMYYFF